MEAIERRLRVMDSTALALCMDNGMPLCVFNMDDESEPRAHHLGRSRGHARALAERIRVEGARGAEATPVGASSGRASRHEDGPR